MATVFPYFKWNYSHVNWPVSILEEIQKQIYQNTQNAWAHLSDRNFNRYHQCNLFSVDQWLQNKFCMGVWIRGISLCLDFYGIELSKNAAPLLKYAERIFSRPAYIEALTPSEKVMRK